jgi:hypothetical protein
VAKQFLEQVVEQARAKGWTSDEHFTVDGTLLEAWAGAKSFQRKDGKNPPSTDDPGNPTVNFHGEKRSHKLDRLCFGYFFCWLASAGLARCPVPYGFNS